ncbi:MAG: hypothetical protein E6H10_05490 [Bacteroidetes bacterium]|nr:MAG: hypothetical protein E6H10_05490 [Bacteroidota bacterium]
MKKLLPLIVFAAMMATSAVAQDQKQAPQPSAQKPAVQEQKDVKVAQDQKTMTTQDRAAWEKKFKEDLKLTDEQSQKFDALSKEYTDKFDAIAKDATLTPDAQKEKKMGLKKEKEGKLMEILTPEQQAKYKEWKESMEKKPSDIKQ